MPKCPYTCREHNLPCDHGLVVNKNTPPRTSQTTAIRGQRVLRVAELSSHNWPQYTTVLILETFQEGAPNFRKPSTAWPRLISTRIPTQVSPMKELERTWKLLYHDLKLWGLGNREEKAYTIFETSGYVSVQNM